MLPSFNTISMTVIYLKIKKGSDFVSEPPLDYLAYAAFYIIPFPDQ